MLRNDFHCKWAPVLQKGSATRGARLAARNRLQCRDVRHEPCDQSYFTVAMAESAARGSLKWIAEE